MFKTLIIATGFLYILCGCATPPPPLTPPPIASVPWQDQAFGYDAATITIGKTELFQLDRALQTSIRNALPRLVTPDEKLTFLTTLLFGPDGHSFPYALHHSTIAEETWQRMRGDCLSLTVLAYSIAKALGLSSSMQQVQVPVVYNRSGDVDFVTGHVNLLIVSKIHLNSSYTKSGYVLIDFEPQIGSWERGQDLTEEGVLARYYNNIGAEYLAAGNQNMAYSYFKSAVLADPAYSSSYGNLAQLYLHSGFDQEAEKLLRYAVASNQNDYPSLKALSHLLSSQGRTTEASQFSAMLRAKQDQDPYYWLGLGLAYLKEGHLQKSVDALERAQNLSVGFRDVHQYLAIAYWRTGKQAEANKQLAILATMGQDSTALALLRKKISQPPS